MVLTNSTQRTVGLNAATSYVPSHSEHAEIKALPKQKRPPDTHASLCDLTASQAPGGQRQPPLSAPARASPLSLSTPLAFVPGLRHQPLQGAGPRLPGWLRPRRRAPPVGCVPCSPRAVPARSVWDPLRHQARVSECPRRVLPALGAGSHTQHRIRQVVSKRRRVHGASGPVPGTSVLHFAPKKHTAATP